MASGKTDQLVKQLRQWYETHSMPQKDLASALALSPQQLAEIFSGRNRPTGSQVLEIIAFLEKHMNTTSIGSRKSRTVGDPDEHLDLLNGKPQTLTDARELIDGLRSQLNQRGGSATMTSPKAATGPTPNPPPAQAPPIDPTTDPGFKRVQTPPGPPAKQLPASANTPFLITEILKVTNFADLLSMLDNPKHTNLQRSLIYSAVKERRDLEANRQ